MLRGSDGGGGIDDGGGGYCGGVMVVEVIVRCGRVGRWGRI